jgi:hypothetical protein
MNIQIFNNTTPGEGFTSVLSVSTLALLVIFNIWAYVLLLNNTAENLTNPDFKSQFRELYEQYKINDKRALIFQSLILSRNIVCVVILMMLGNYPLL